MGQLILGPKIDITSQMSLRSRLFLILVFLLLSSFYMCISVVRCAVCVPSSNTTIGFYVAQCDPASGNLLPVYSVEDVMRKTVNWFFFLVKL